MDQDNNNQSNQDQVLSTDKIKRGSFFKSSMKFLITLILIISIITGILFALTKKDIIYFGVGKLPEKVVEVSTFTPVCGQNIVDDFNEKITPSSDPNRTSEQNNSEIIIQFAESIKSMEGVEGDATCQFLLLIAAYNEGNAEQMQIHLDNVLSLNERSIFINNSLNINTGLLEIMELKVQ